MVVVADVDAAERSAVAATIAAGGRATARGALRRHRNQAQVDEAVRAAATLGPLRTCWCSPPRSRAARPSWTARTRTGSRILDVNLKGPFLCMQAGDPAHRRAAAAARCIALGSTLGLIVAPGHPGLLRQQGALVSLCKQAAIEHAPDSVRVNVVAPSATDTGPVHPLLRAGPDPEAPPPHRRARTRCTGSAPPEEVCDAVMFLASDQSDLHQRCGDPDRRRPRGPTDVTAMLTARRRHDGA